MDQPRNFSLDSRAERLAHYLRECLGRRRLGDPLPSTRIWSRRLGVSRPTLLAAVGQLQREGLLVVQSRGIRLNRKNLVGRARKSSPLVRALFYRAWNAVKEQQQDLITGLEEGLRAKQIDFDWEFCDAARLRDFSRHPPHLSEALVLVSVPPRYHRLFAGNASAIVSGEVESGCSLPYIAGDYAGTVRHASFYLMRRGFRRLILVYPNVGTVGLRRAASFFHSACAAWRGCSIAAHPVPTALDPHSLLTTAGRVARMAQRQCGIIVMAPVPIAVMTTALLHHGARVPHEVEIVAIYQSEEAALLYPPPVRYLRPIRQHVKLLVEAAIHYFQSGRMPAIQAMMPAKMVAPVYPAHSRPNPHPSADAASRPNFRPIGFSRRARIP